LAIAALHHLEIEPGFLHFCADRRGPDEQVKLCTEVMAESRRNPEIARIVREIDARNIERFLTSQLVYPPSSF